MLVTTILEWRPRVEGWRTRIDMEHRKRETTSQPLFGVRRLHSEWGGKKASPEWSKVRNESKPPNYPLIYPKYLLLRAIRAPLKGHWGVLEWEVPAKIQSQVSCYSVGHVPSKDTVETQSEP